MEINLIPQEEQKISAWPQIAKTLVFAFITVLILAGILLARYSFGLNKIAFLKNRENNLIEQEKNISNYKTAYENYRQSAATKILEKHAYYSELFKFIEASTPTYTYIKRISVNNNFTATLEGETIGHTEVAKFANFLEKTGFTNVAINNSSKNEDEKKVTFSLNFTFSDDETKKDSFIKRSTK